MGRAVLEGGGGGGWDPKICVPKMAQPDFPCCKFPFFPLWSIWSGGGAVQRGVTPPSSTVHSHSNNSLAVGMDHQDCPWLDDR